MNFSPQSGESWRLGDLARSTTPDGDYVGIVSVFDAATGKNGQPQIKVVMDLRGPQTGKKHTFWYTCTRDGAFRLFDDLIRLGADPQWDPGPPVDSAGNNRWVSMLAPNFIGKAFHINVSTNKDFTNTSLMAPAQLGPDGQPASTSNNGPSLSAGVTQGPFPSTPPTPTPTPTATVDVGGAVDLFRKA